MLMRKNGGPLQCVVVDVNTQLDFCDPLGAFPVHNAKELLPQLRRVVAWAKRNHAPVVSSVESHRPLELSDSGYPICCCVDGSGGQKKLEFTLFARRAWIEADNTFAIPGDLFSQFQQVIFHKRTEDLLSNPKADRLLSQLPVEEFVLFGTGAETSVKVLALALMARGKRVAVVQDACGFWSKATADLALRQIEAKGATIIGIDDLKARRLDRAYRYPHKAQPVDTDGEKSLAASVFRKPSPRVHPDQQSLSKRSRGVKLRSKGANGSRRTEI